MWWQFFNEIRHIKSKNTEKKPTHVLCIYLGVEPLGTDVHTACVEYRDTHEVITNSKN